MQEKNQFRNFEPNLNHTFIKCWPGWILVWITLCNSQLWQLNTCRGFLRTHPLGHHIFPCGGVIFQKVWFPAFEKVFGPWAVGVYRLFWVLDSVPHITTPHTSSHELLLHYKYQTMKPINHILHNWYYEPNSASSAHRTDFSPALTSVWLLDIPVISFLMLGKITQWNTYLNFPLNLFAKLTLNCFLL